MTTLTRVHIRWMIRRDMLDVLPIENESFPEPWTEDDFTRSLRCRNVIGMVAERDNVLAGFMVYRLHKTRIELLNLAVAPGWRRQSVGSQLVAKLQSKLSHKRRTRLEVVVRERNLPAQKFLAACGLRATGVLRDHWREGEDAYEFVYDLPPDGEAPRDEELYA